MSISVECIEFANTYQKKEDRFCKSHKYLETKWLQERLDVCAENLNFLGPTCELCNARDHFSTQCELFHDRIVSKNCDDLISLAHHNELSLLLGYEEMKRITKVIPKFSLDRVLNFDLEEIYMYCAVNCIENPYIANYIKTRKQIEDEENTNEREEVSQYLLLFLMMNQVTRKSLLFNQYH